MRRRSALRMRALLVVASASAFVVPRRGLARVALGNYSVSTTLALREYALNLRDTGFVPCADDGQEVLGDLVGVVADLEAVAAVEAPELGKYFSSAYGRVAAARVARAASLATTLPRIFDLSFKAISTIVLASFLLVDLGSPQFEAILFAVLACSFYLLESFVDDLETRSAAVGPSTRRSTRATSSSTRSP